MISESRRRNVLALDLGTATGWCMGAFQARPRCGAITLRGVEPVHRQAALRDWLDEQDQFRGITAVVVEAALIGQFSSQQAEMVTIALHSTVALWAFDLEIPVYPIASSTVRAQMLGTARFPKGEAKKHVMAWCRGAGFTGASDDAADAVLTWHAAEAKALGTQRAPKPGLLAAGRAA
jgi:hypothetical protein